MARQRRRTRLLQIGGGVVVALVIVAIVVARLRQQSSSDAAAAAGGVGCSTTEQLVYHTHAHLDIFVNGQPVTIPANIGIEPTCIYWLHTHDTTGVIHEESPVQKTLTLGQFFKVWGQPLDATHLLNYTADSTQPIKSYVNGKPYNGPPQDIPLDERAEIVLEYGSPEVTPPASYNFPPGD